MTDKQIIIDVSKCKECGLRNCEGNLIYWCHTYDDHCKDFDNCYYKQLKAKEQECERLKEDRERWKSNFNGKVSAIEELLQQLDQLKEQLEAYKMEADEGKEINAELKAENDKLKGKVKLYEEILQRNAQGFETGTQASMFAEMVNGVANSIKDEKLFKLKATLAEIKEIAEPFCNACQEFEPEKKGRNCMYCNYGKILQKISEVEKCKINI